MLLFKLKIMRWLIFMLMGGWLLTGCHLADQQRKVLSFESDAYLLPLLTDFSSLSSAVLEQQRLFEFQHELNFARLKYSYLLLEKNCEAENGYEEEVKNMLDMTDRRREAGIARESEYFRVKIDALEAGVNRIQCALQLDLLKSYARANGVSLESLEKEMSLLDEAIDMEAIKGAFVDQPAVWKALEWPVQKLVLSINGKFKMDQALSMKLLVHTKITMSAMRGFQVGLTSTQGLLEAEFESYDVERKLNHNRMEMMMGLAELSYLLAKPIKVI